MRDGTIGRWSRSSAPWLPCPARASTSRTGAPVGKTPDKPEVAIAHLRAQAAALADRAAVPPASIVLGGRSFGGRMCSMAVAQGLPAAGLVLLSYPLHPPGRPDRLRVEHFPEIAVPVLFVCGERDPFGSPDEFAAHVGAIPGAVTQVWVPGGHDPKQDAAVGEAVTHWLATLKAGVSRRRSAPPGTAG